MRKVLSRMRSPELLLRFGRIAVIGVETPVYEMPNSRYVTRAQRNLPLPDRSGDQNIITKKSENGSAIHSQYGRDCPQRVRVWSMMKPQTGASNASRMRAASRIVPAAATERPNTSV